MAEVITVQDTIEVSTESPIVINIGSPRTTVHTKPELGLTQVSLSDSYQVVPYAKRLTMDFTLPESISQGLITNVAALNQAIIDEAASREIAIIDATNYAKDYADGVEQQVYNNINAEYIANATNNAYALKDGLTTLALSFNTGTGTTTATLQDIYSTSVSVENTQATLNTDVQAIADGTSALVTRTEDLEVAIDGTNGINARLSTVEGIAGGVFTVWYGPPETPLVGMVKFTDPYNSDLRTTELSIQDTDVQWQYLGGTLGSNGDGWVRTDESSILAVDNATAALNISIGELQDQIDGVIDSWFGDYEPSLSTEPALTWVNTDTTNGNTIEQDKHTGDLFYDNTTGAAYRFINTAGTYSWLLITDTAITNALAAASAAQDTADSKRRTFTNTPYVPYDVGDLWTQGSTGDLYRCITAKASDGVYNIADWELATKYTDDTAVTTLQTGLENGTVAVDLTNSNVGGTAFTTYLNNELDGIVSVFSGTDHTTAVGMKTNDLYIETTTTTTTSGYDLQTVATYRFNGTSWVQETVDGDIAALADMADGKRTIYSNDVASVPVGEENDIWIPSTDLTAAGTYTVGEVYQSISGVWTLATKYTEDLNVFSTAVSAQIADLEAVRDGEIVIFYETLTTDPIGMTYGDYVLLTGSWNGTEYAVYRYEDIDGRSTGTLDWRLNTGEMAKSLSASYRADVLAGDAQSTADGKRIVFYQDTSPTATSVGDVWVNSTDGVMTVWNGIAWGDTTNAGVQTVEGWAGSASKLITGPNGEVTGWSFADGSNVNSTFSINADNFYVQNSLNDITSRPFAISGNNIVFNGLVTFGNNQTGTIDQAVSAVVETVSVGDKNINITDNLIPTTSLISDLDNSGYQFIETPTKSSTSGIDAFSEAQIALDTIDEVYSPYVDELTVSYYYRFGITGITDLTMFKVVTIDSLNAATYSTVTVTLEAGQSLIGTNWYIVEGLINPVGGTTTPDGVVRDVNGTKIATINNFVVPASAVLLLLGWYAPCTISRMKLAKVTADTVTNSYATMDYTDAAYIRPEDAAAAVNNNTTTINGSKISTGSISANRLQPATGSSTTWSGGSIVSQDFNGNDFGTIGAPTAGFRLSSDGAGTFDDPTIYGAYIRSGNIYGTNIESATLISSTINVKDLIVTTDAGYTTDSIIASSAQNLLYDTVSRNWVKWDYSLYAYNNPTDTPRFAGTTVKYQAFGNSSFRTQNGNGTDVIDITYNGWVLLIDGNNTGTMNVTVKVGTTTIASSNIVSDATVSIAGIKFRNHEYTSDGASENALWMEPVGDVTGIAGTSGKLNIYVTNAGAGNLGNPKEHYLAIHNL